VSVIIENLFRPCERFACKCNDVLFSVLVFFFHDVYMLILVTYTINHTILLNDAVTHFRSVC